MLEWLLNPTRRHGLGSALATRFVKYCTEESVPVPVAVRKVTRSEWRGGREADLVVRGDDFTLVIEIKVDADEQPSQCDDLYKNFEHEKGALFLFLTPGGRKPQTATTPGAQSKFRTLSWREVRRMIAKTLDESLPPSRAAVARDVVWNYHRTLKEQFG